MLNRRNRYEHDLTIFDMETMIRNSMLNIVDEDDNTKVFLQGSDIADYLISNFSTYHYIMVSDKDENTIENTDVEDSFLVDYENFVSREYENLKRLYEAYYEEEYNPLDNYYRKGNIIKEYEGKEKDTIQKSGSENERLDFNGTETNEHVKSGSEVESIGQQENVTVEKVSPENDETFVNTNKSENTLGAQNNTLSFNNRTDNDTKTFNNRYNNNTKSFTNRQDVDTKEFIDRVDTENYNIHGNNGNISNQTLLNEELKIRNFDLLSWFVKKFANEYLVPNKPYRKIIMWGGDFIW